MSALAAYGASELAPSAMDLGVAVGKAIGTAAIAKGKKAYDARRRGRSVSRSRSRSREHRSLNELGRAPGHSEAKRNNTESPPTSISNKEMESQPLISIEKDVAGSEVITKRQRDTVLHKGVKICFTCKNIIDKTVFLNWAIVSPKAVNQVNSGNLLRGSELERYLPFANTNTFLDLRCAPINTDRYNVLRHHRKTIRPDSDKATGAGTNAVGTDLVIIEEYIKTNRQVFFNGDTPGPLTNIFMVWWVDYYGSPTGSTISTADVSWKLINYFKEI